MATFEKCDNSVRDMAAELLVEFETHKPLVDAKVDIDFVFAYGPRNEDTGELTGDALKKNGVKALGIARIVPAKDRALGRGDAEVALDGDWWNDASEDERRALLDHELHHFALKLDQGQNLKRDDLGRPMLRMRKHDVDIGWFNIIAERHGRASNERIQAQAIMEHAGQYYWPEIAEGIKGTGRFSQLEGLKSTVTISTPGHAPVVLTGEEFKNAAKNIANLAKT